MLWYILFFKFFFNFMNCLDAQICPVLMVKKCRLKIVDYLSGYRYLSARYSVVRCQSMAARRRRSLTVRCQSMAARRRRSLTVRRYLNVMVNFIFKNFLVCLSRCTDWSSINGSKWRKKIVDYLSGYQHPSARYPTVRHRSLAVRHRSMAVRQYLAELNKNTFTI
jgi:hypothetical protein